MSASAAIDAARLPRLYPDTRPSPLWWGVIGLILIEATVFASLVAGYFYLRLLGDGPWAGRSLPAPPLLIPSVNLVLLLVSSGSMYLAGRLIKRGRVSAMTWAIGISVGLAAVVLALRGLELRAVAFTWDAHAYGSIYWTMMGLHFTHVLASALGTAVVGVLGALGYFTRERHLAVSIDSIYWYFVALIWIPVYLVLYWSPRLLPA